MNSGSPPSLSTLREARDRPDQCLGGWGGVSLMTMTLPVDSRQSGQVSDVPDPEVPKPYFRRAPMTAAHARLSASFRPVPSSP